MNQKQFDTYVENVFETLTERRNWINTYAHFLQCIWGFDTLDDIEVGIIAEKILKEDERKQKPRFTFQELFNKTPQTLLQLEKDRVGENVDPLKYLLENSSYIAFGFDYNGGEPSEIIVSNITSFNSESVLCHFSYGHQSLAEFVEYENIIGIGIPAQSIMYAKIKQWNIPGWNGKYRIFKKDLFNQIIKKCSED